jgi:hypothetical protein
MSTQPSRKLCPILRYVVHTRVGDYLLLGWLPIAPLGEWSILMGWPCECVVVEPESGGAE